jgi:hypothetical protein
MNRDPHIVEALCSRWREGRRRGFRRGVVVGLVLGYALFLLLHKVLS